MKNLLTEYTEYNFWANQQIAGVLESIDQELIDMEVKNSFPTIRKTINHIWDAEYIWLQRLKGNSLDYWPSSRIESGLHLGMFAKTSGEFAKFVGTKEEDYLLKYTIYINTQGVEYSTQNSGIILHTMNHSSFHRGQIITMLRTVGIDQLPGTDLIKYLRQKEM